MEVYLACITTRSDEDTETLKIGDEVEYYEVLASPPDPMRILKLQSPLVCKSFTVLASPPDPMRILKPERIWRAMEMLSTCITTRSDEDTETAFPSA